MQKSDLVEKIADEAGISKAAARRALDSLLGNVTKALKSGDRISLVGFGTFSVSKRNARMGRNPQTGETIQIKASKVPKFTAGKSLKEARKAAGLDRTGGGRGKKDPEAKAPKVTSPTTLSEFFGAAGRGELGPIAARTPSTKDIEPTVAIDITNNNFKFDVKQTITGTTSAADTAKEVAKAIRVEFQSRLSSAGQQLATNVVR